MREEGKDWTGNSVYLWAIANAAYMALLGPEGFARARRADHRPQPLRRAAPRRDRRRADRLPGGFFKEFVVDFDATGKTVAEINRRPAKPRHLRRQGSVAGLPRAGAVGPLLRHRDPHPGRHRPAGRGRGGGGRVTSSALPRRRLGRAGRHGDGSRRDAAGVVFDEPSRTSPRLVGDLDALVPAGLRAATPPDLPELSEPEVQRHYLQLSQETLGMMGISLFGTCTMKYNPRLATEMAARPEIAELHPRPARRDAAGRAGARPRLRPDPARAVGHGRSSSSRPAAAPMPPTPMPSSPAPTTPPAASSSSATRSSPRSRRIPATRRPRPRPASRWSR